MHATSSPKYDLIICENTTIECPYEWKFLNKNIINKIKCVLKFNIERKLNDNIVIRINTIMYMLNQISEKVVTVARTEMMVTRQCLSKFELMMDINDKFVRSPEYFLNSKELDIETIEHILSFMDENNFDDLMLIKIVNNMYSYNKLCNEFYEIFRRNP